MRRLLLLSTVFALVGTGVAFAQEQGAVGPGRVEIGSAIFGGGALILPSAGASQSRSTSYVVGGAVTVNLDNHLGVEGDLGLGLSHNQSMSIYGTAPIQQHVPSMLNWSGSLVYSPLGIHHKLVPYVEGGLGALTVFGAQTDIGVGLAAQTTYFASNAGGGVRWFPVPHWGARADYRFISIDNNGRGLPVGGPTITKSAQRIYVALVLTF